MDASQYADSVGLTPAELNQLLDKLDDPSTDSSSENRRRHARGRRRLCDVELEVEHVGGGTSRSLCCTRNLCARGVSLIHGSFVHIGSKVRITLGRVDGERVTLTGTVIQCRHIKGKLHEIGVALDEVMDPSVFIHDDESLAVIREEQLAEVPEIRGWVLHLTESTVDAQLVAYHLRATGVEINLVESEDQAWDQLRQGIFDAVLIDVDGLSVEAISLVTRIRGENFPGRLVVLTADEQSPAAELKEAGADEVVLKPYPPGTLQAILMEGLERAGCFVRGGKIYSTLSDEPALAGMIASFVHEVQRSGRALDKAAADDLTAVRATCLRLKGTGGGFGFQIVADRATEALVQLDSCGSVSESMRQLRQLSLVCSRIAVHKLAS